MKYFKFFFASVLLLNHFCGEAQLWHNFPVDIYTSKTVQYRLKNWFPEI